MIVSWNSVFPWLHIFIWFAVEPMCFSRAATAMRQDGPSESFPAEVLDAWETYAERMACFEYRSRVKFLVNSRVDFVTLLHYRKGTKGMVLHSLAETRDGEPVIGTWAIPNVEGYNAEYSFEALIHASGFELGQTGASSLAEVGSVTPGSTLIETPKWRARTVPVGLRFFNEVSWSGLARHEGLQVEQVSVSGAAGSREIDVRFCFSPSSDGVSNGASRKAVGADRIDFVIRTGRAVFCERDLFLPSSLDLEIKYPFEPDWSKVEVTQEFVDTAFGRLPATRRELIQVGGVVGSGGKVAEETRTCEWLSVGKDFPESDFRLSGFGLPEPSFVKPKRNLVRRLVVIGVCVIAGVLVVRQIRKTRR